MNKFIKALASSFMVIILALLTIQPLSARGLPASTVHETLVSETTLQLDNGMSVTILITEEPTRSTRAMTYTKSGSKYYIFRDSDGNELFRFTVTGVFTVVPDVSATCTSASYSTSISDDAWEVDSASAYASGNQAIGSATFIKKVLFVTVDTASCDVTLTCDVNGSLS